MSGYSQAKQRNSIFSVFLIDQINDKYIGVIYC